MGEKTEIGKKPLLVVRFARIARRKRVGGVLPAKRIFGIEFLLRLGMMDELEMMRATCSAPLTRLGLISILQAICVVSVRDCERKALSREPNCNTLLRSRVQVWMCRGRESSVSASCCKKRSSASEVGLGA